MKKYLFILPCLFISFFSFGQKTLYQQEAQKLNDILYKCYRQNLQDDNIEFTLLFSLRVTISPEKKITGIVPSKYTPRKIKEQIANAGLYTAINWEVLGAKEEGTVFIIPMYIYPLELPTILPAYTIQAQFEYEGANADTDKLKNKILMDPLSVGYGKPIQ